MLLLLLFCMSCGRKEHDKQNKRIVHDHIGREMLFPKDIVYTRFLKDTIDYRMPENVEYKYNPQIQISAESETKRSIFREKDKTKRSKKESAQHSKSRNKSFVMTSVSAL